MFRFQRLPSLVLLKRFTTWPQQAVKQNVQNLHLQTGNALGIIGGIQRFYAARDFTSACDQAIDGYTSVFFGLSGRFVVAGRRNQVLHQVVDLAARQPDPIITGH